MKDKRIILIGAGNVAHHLAPALLKAGLNLCQIYSRSIESARELGRKTGITYTADLFGIYPDGDIYIFCVSDDALLSLFKSIRINKEAIILHTFQQHNGVLVKVILFQFEVVIFSVV